MQIFGFAAGPYKTNTYVIAQEGHAVVIDPGMHAASKVYEIARDNNLVLDAVILTHGHLDHTREAGDIAARESIPVFIHEADEFMLEAGEGVSPQSQVLFDSKGMLPIADIRHVGNGDTLSASGLEWLELTVLHCPGHSPGSVIYVGDDFALTGDVVFKGSIGRTDLQHSDPEQMKQTLAGPVLELDDSLALLPGHGPTTTMRAERRTNPFLNGMADVV